MTGQLTLRLIRTLDELIDLLGEENETHWAAWMRRASRELKAGDYHGIERLLAASGGMGSFNDLVPQDADNRRRLDEISAQVYDLAIEISRNQ